MATESLEKRKPIFDEGWMEEKEKNSLDDVFKMDLLVMNCDENYN